MTKEKIQKPGLISNTLKMGLLLPVLVVGLGIGGKAQDFVVEIRFDTPASFCAGGGFAVSMSNDPNLQPDSCAYALSIFQWQWQEDPSANWENIPSSSNFSGINSFELTGMGIPIGFDGYSFRLVVTATSMVIGCDNLTGTSAALTITVGDQADPLASISINPANGSLCPGPDINYTLTAMPTNDPTQIVWYRGDPNSGGTQVFTGNPYNASSSGTYFARREIAGCGTTTAISREVTFQTASTAPTTVTATPDTICAGESIMLTASGGVAGAGTSLHWYSMPNGGGTALGTGSSIIQSPSVSTTYYVRREGAGGCGTPTADGQVTVLVKTPPQPFTTITASNAQPCTGAPISLTASGGIDQVGQMVVWYDGPNGTGMELGPGKTLPISSAEDKTYYVRRENGCPNGNSPDQSIAITTRPAPAAAIEMPAEVTCVGETVTFQATEDPDIVSYQWSFTGATPSSYTGPGPVDVVFNVVGQRTISLTVDNGSCTNTLDASIDVLDEPTLLLDDVLLTNSVETFTVTEKLSATLVLSSNLPEGAFSWSCEEDEPGSLSGSPGSGADSLVRHNWVLADKAGEAALTCTATVTQGNCENMVEFKILVKRLIFVPNVLTANGDEFNQCWEIELGPDMQFDPTDFEIELYSRGGECVRGCQETFTVADAVEMCGEDCPGAGTYWYVIKGPEGFSATGALTIIK